MTIPHILGAGERLAAAEAAAQERGEERAAATEPTAAGGGGLVICARTARLSETAGGGGDLTVAAAAGGRRYASLADVRAAAADIGGWRWDGREGAVPQIEVAPGLVRITAPNLSRREATANRNADAPIMPVDESETTPRLISEWSRKSRARMIARLAELDYSPMMDRVEFPAMVTLTYPGEWEELVPNGKVAKKHLHSFFKRFERAWGEEWTGIWKMEFQRRGAPHFHLFMPIPQGKAGDHFNKLGQRYRPFVGVRKPFYKWLSLVWADIVGSTGEQRRRHLAAGTGVDFAEGLRARDPKRLAVYFSKHGSFSDKEYQHSVPDLWRESEVSVGRFWGYRGLEPVKGAATVTPEQAIRMARVLRGMSAHSSRWNEKEKRVELVPALRRVRRPRWKVDDDGTIHEQLRMQTVRVKRMAGAQFGAGYVCVNDGPAVARQLSRYLAQRQAPPRPAVGLRGRITDRLQPPPKDLAEDRRAFDDGRDAARLRLLGDAPVLPLIGG